MEKQRKQKKKKIRIYMNTEKVTNKKGYPYLKKIRQKTTINYPYMRRV